MMSSILSRTSSAASISSDDAARRTRKRFTSVQLMILEQLFHQSSHPTREEREAVAQAAGMEMKSVTIWFQNKRQTERKVALHYATTQSADGHRTAPFPSSPSALSSPYASSSTSASARTPHTRTLSTTSTHPPRRKITPPRPRPSLDRVAARSESRLPPPRTPKKPHDPHASLWDNMPSSPLAPPASPPSRDLVEFMSSSRTLEWACAAARLADKQGRQQPRERERQSCSSNHERDCDHEWEEDVASASGVAGDDTEEDDMEAVTPEGSLGASDAARWHGTHAVRTRPGLFLPAFTPTLADPLSGTVHIPASASARTKTWPPPFPLETDVPGRGYAEDAPQDDDMMRAALALCGLGRRSG